MKKITVLLLLICMLVMCLVSCGHKHEWGAWEIMQNATLTNAGVEYHVCECGETETRGVPKLNPADVLAGKWVWKGHANNPMERYLLFSGNTDKFATTIFGSDLDAATWNCSYSVVGTTLKLTTSEGTEFIFSVKEIDGMYQIFDDAGNEYVYKK